MRCVALLVFLAAFAAASPTLLRRDSSGGSDNNSPPVDLSLECVWSQDGQGTCDAGLICDSDPDNGDGFCHPILKTGQVCDSYKGFCEDSAYCLPKNPNDEAGVCTAKAGLGAACGSDMGTPCQHLFACFAADAKAPTNQVCVSLPRKPGETCDYNAFCDKDHYCKDSGKTGVLRTCQPRVAEGQVCGTVSGPIFVECNGDLACYTTMLGTPGTCMKRKAGLTEKCSRSGPYCDSETAYCHYNQGKISGVCNPKAKASEACPNVDKYTIVPCVKGYVCYKDDQTSPVCVADVGRKVGEKCTDLVNCINDAYCEMVPKKTFGTCKAKAGLGQTCGGPSNIKCQDGTNCKTVQEHGIGQCVQAFGASGDNCDDIWKCGSGLTCTQHPRNPQTFTCL